MEIPDHIGAAIDGECMRVWGVISHYNRTRDTAYTMESIFSEHKTKLKEIFSFTP